MFGFNIKRLGIVALTLVASLAIGAGVAFGFTQPATPAGGLASGTMQVTVNGTATTATTTVYSLKSWGNYETADIFVYVQQGTVNTTTFTIQASADGSTWHTPTGATFLTSTATGYATPVRVNATGMFYRVVLSGTTATGITPTVKVVLK